MTEDAPETALCSGSRMAFITGGRFVQELSFSVVMCVAVWGDFVGKVSGVLARPVDILSGSGAAMLRLIYSRTVNGFEIGGVETSAFLHLQNCWSVSISVYGALYWLFAVRRTGWCLRLLFLCTLASFLVFVSAGSLVFQIARSGGGQVTFIHGDGVGSVLLLLVLAGSWCYSLQRMLVSNGTTEEIDGGRADTSVQVFADEEDDQDLGFIDRLRLKLIGRLFLLHPHVLMENFEFAIRNLMKKWLAILAGLPGAVAICICLVVISGCVDRDGERGYFHGRFQAAVQGSSSYEALAAARSLCSLVSDDGSTVTRLAGQMWDAGFYCGAWDLVSAFHSGHDGKSVSSGVWLCTHNRDSSGGWPHLDAQSCIELLNAALAAHPKNAQLHSLLSVELLRVGDPVLGVEAARRAAELSEDFFPHYVHVLCLCGLAKDEIPREFMIRLRILAREKETLIQKTDFSERQVIAGAKALDALGDTADLIDLLETASTHRNSEVLRGLLAERLVLIAAEAMVKSSWEAGYVKDLITRAIFWKPDCSSALLAICQLEIAGGNTVDVNFGEVVRLLQQRVRNNPPVAELQRNLLIAQILNDDAPEDPAVYEHLMTVFPDCCSLIVALLHSKGRPEIAELAASPLTAGQRSCEFRCLADVLLANYEADRLVQLCRTKSESPLITGRTESVVRLALLRAEIQKLDRDFRMEKPSAGRIDGWTLRIPTAQKLAAMTMLKEAARLPQLRMHAADRLVRVMLDEPQAVDGDAYEILCGLIADAETPEILLCHIGCTALSLNCTERAVVWFDYAQRFRGNLYPFLNLCHADALLRIGGRKNYERAAELCREVSHMYPMSATRAFLETKQKAAEMVRLSADRTSADVMSVGQPVGANL